MSADIGSTDADLRQYPEAGERLDRKGILAKMKGRTISVAGVDRVRAPSRLLTLHRSADSEPGVVVYPSMGFSVGVASTLKPRSG